MKKITHRQEPALSLGIALALLWIVMQQVQLQVLGLERRLTVRLRHCRRALQMLRIVIRSAEGGLSGETGEGAEREYRGVQAPAPDCADAAANPHSCAGRLLLREGRARALRMV